MASALENSDGMLDLKKCEKNSAGEDRHQQQGSQDFCQEGLIRFEL